MKPSQNRSPKMLFRTVALHSVGTGRADSARASSSPSHCDWVVVVPHKPSGATGSACRGTTYPHSAPRTPCSTRFDVRRTFRVYYDACRLAGRWHHSRTHEGHTPPRAMSHAKTGSVASAIALRYVTHGRHHMLIFTVSSSVTTGRSPVRVGRARTGCDRPSPPRRATAR